jgi:hypothetical protein
MWVQNAPAAHFEPTTPFFLRRYFDWFFGNFVKEDTFSHREAGRTGLIIANNTNEILLSYWITLRQYPPIFQVGSKFTRELQAIY